MPAVGEVAEAFKFDSLTVAFLYSSKKKPLCNSSPIWPRLGAVRRLDDVDNTISRRAKRATLLERKVEREYFAEEAESDVVHEFIASDPLLIMKIPESKIPTVVRDPGSTYLWRVFWSTASSTNHWRCHDSPSTDMLPGRSGWESQQ